VQVSRESPEDFATYFSKRKAAEDGHSRVWQSPGEIAARFLCDDVMPQLQKRVTCLHHQLQKRVTCLHHCFAGSNGPMGSMGSVSAGLSSASAEASMSFAHSATGETASAWVEAPWHLPNDHPAAKYPKVKATFEYLQQHPIEVDGEPMDYEPLRVMAQRCSARTQSTSTSTQVPLLLDF
jgi:hypothetical protein